MTSDFTVPFWSSPLLMGGVFLPLDQNATYDSETRRFKSVTYLKIIQSFQNSVYMQRLSNCLNLKHFRCTGVENLIVLQTQLSDSRMCVLRYCLLLSALLPNASFRRQVFGHIRVTVFVCVTHLTECFVVYRFSFVVLVGSIFALTCRDRV